MNRRPDSYHFGRAIALFVLAALSASCERENTGIRDEELNPQAEEYLDSMADKEEANVKKGWAHVEGDGYYYDKPEGWTESNDIEKGVYFQLSSPRKNMTIRLVSRYIESIPEGVHDLRDWAELQYASIGMSEALQETREIEVSDGDALEVWIKVGESHMRVRYFTDVFQNPENQRMWLLLVEAKERSLLESSQVQDFLSAFRVENFRWLD